MPQLTAGSVLWIVVEVQRGIPVQVRCFRDYDEAARWEESIREGLNLNEDETGIFRWPPTDSGVGLAAVPG
ncbi:MAG: hypothetical protein R6V05_15475 [Candidatus Brocadiia bacterium]